MGHEVHRGVVRGEVGDEGGAVGRVLVEIGVAGLGQHARAGAADAAHLRPPAGDDRSGRRRVLGVHVGDHLGEHVGAVAQGRLDEQGGAEPVGVGAHREHAVGVVGSPHAHPEVGPVGREVHHLGVDPLPAEGVVDADQLQGAPHQQAGPGAGEHHAVPGQHVAQDVDTVPGQPLAGVAIEHAVEHPYDGLGGAHRVVERVDVEHAGRDGGDEVVVTGHGQHGTGHRCRHVAGGPAPHRARCCQRRDQVGRDAERLDRTRPDLPGVLVEQAGAARQRDLGEAGAAQPPGHQLGHVEPLPPTELQALVPVAVPQLGEGRQRTERQAGAPGELRAEVGRHVGHVLGTPGVEPGHDGAGDPVFGVEQGTGFGHPRDTDPGDGGAVGAELGEHLLDGGQQHVRRDLGTTVGQALPRRGAAGSGDLGAVVEEHTLDVRRPDVEPDQGAHRSPPDHGGLGARIGAPGNGPHVPPPQLPVAEGGRHGVDVSTGEGRGTVGGRELAGAGQHHQDGVPGLDPRPGGRGRREHVEAEEGIGLLGQAAHRRIGLRVRGQVPAQRVERLRRERAVAHRPHGGVEAEVEVGLLAGRGRDRPLEHDREVGRLLRLDHEDPRADRVGLARGHQDPVSPTDGHPVQPLEHPRGVLAVAPLGQLLGIDVLGPAEVHGRRPRRRRGRTRPRSCRSRSRGDCSRRPGRGARAPAAADRHRAA